MTSTANYLGRDVAAGMIRARTDETVRRCVAGGPAAIQARLAELDAEWDLDRVLAVAASGSVLGGLLLGTVSSRKWYALPALAGGFLLQHALQGTCPPMRWLRQMGIRTTTEIDQERQALCERLAAANDIPAQHTTHPTKNDFVETASGRIKPASQS